jgi:hypothetical protein
MARKFRSIFITAAALAGCGSNSLGSGDTTSNPMTTGGTQGAGASTGANGGSGTGAGGSTPDSSVVVKIGAGPAPTPQGGAITSGSYVLVAETIYGALPPSMFNLGIGSPGDAVSAQITVTGDMYWQAFQAGGGSGAGSTGRSFRRLSVSPK